MKKHSYIIVDTETTKNQTVADFGAVVVDRQGRVVERLGAMVTGHFGKFDLFSDPTAPTDSLWSKQSAKRRAKDYYAMMENGSRIWASVAFINQWLAAVNARAFAGMSLLTIWLLISANAEIPASISAFSRNLFV